MGGCCAVALWIAILYFSQLIIDRISQLQSNGGRLRLDALRVEPVQRVPRYVLLLGDLLKHTPEEHPDFEVLQKATTEIGSIAHSINERKRENENRVRIEGLSRQLRGNRRATRESFRPGDELVGDTHPCEYLP